MCVGLGSSQTPLNVDTCDIVFDAFGDKTLHGRGVKPEELATFSPRTIETDCAMTALSVLILFVGESYAQRITSFLKRSTFVTLSLEGRVVLLTGMFDGYALSRIDNTAFTLCSETELEAYYELSIDCVLAKTHAIWLKKISKKNILIPYTLSHLNKVFYKVDYCVNRIIFDKFKTEMEAYFNSKEPQNSKICCFRLNTDIESCFHTGLIELFWSVNSNGPRYRLYQSWINEASLRDDMIKQGYETAMPWEKTREEFTVFLGNLEKSVCDLKSFHDDVVEARTNAFGYRTELGLFSWPSYRSNAQTGLTFRFFIESFEPSDMWSHLPNAELG